MTRATATRLRSNTPSATLWKPSGQFRLKLLPRLFPTLYPDAIAEKLVPQLVAAHNLPYGPLIGLVPGVGHLRPHRGWIFDGWVYLARYILDEYKHIPVLIGGPEDFELAQRINMEAGSRCINLCGQLQLDETAAILKCCDVVVSGDTGPAHIAVAVGTPVIGLYGPTYPARAAGRTETLISYLIKIRLANVSGKSFVSLLAQVSRVNVWAKLCCLKC
jgi:ADP-heptose:LPS heptosyltransferase